jgi:hypothetical protein
MSKTPLPLGGGVGGGVTPLPQGESLGVGF